MRPAPRARTLGFGQFFGSPETRHELSGFTLSRIVATRPPAEVPDHIHESAHLVLVVAGDYVTSATAIEPGRPPVLVYNPPATTHADRFRDNHGVFFTLSVSDRRLESVGLGRLPAHALSLSSGPAVRLARRLARGGEGWPRRWRARTEGLCLEVLGALFDDAACGRPRPPAWLVTARDTLASRYDDVPSVRDLAMVAAVHPVHLIRSFRRFYGVTPRVFLRACRLDAAARLLRTTDLPIVEIALRTGFADQSHLTRAFRRGHEIPPAAYRRGVRNSG